MLSDRTLHLFMDIVSETRKMVSARVSDNDLAGRIDYATIYACSDVEFESVTQELKVNGKSTLPHDTGDYFLLDTPLHIDAYTIRYCRILIHDGKHPELGYADFEVKDYPGFKRKYATKPHFRVVDVGEEMIELRDPAFDVRAYFLSGEW